MPVLSLRKLAGSELGAALVLGVRQRAGLTMNIGRSSEIIHETCSNEVEQGLKNNPE